MALLLKVMEHLLFYIEIIMNNKSVKNQNYNLSKDEYNHLYKKYIKHREPMAMLKEVGIASVKDKVIWDICCGANMRATKDFLLNGAKFVYSIDNYDFAPELEGLEKTTSLKDKFLNEKYHLLYQGGIENFVKNYFCLKEKDNNILQPDIIFCQQGMSYIFDASLILRLKNCLKPPEHRSRGLCCSSFVFNIPFYNSEKRQKMISSNLVKRYILDDEQYVENSWIDGEENFFMIGNTDILHHIQWCKSLGSHYTKFYYLNHVAVTYFLKSYEYEFSIKTNNNTVFFRIFA